MIPGSANPLLLATAAPTGYNIERSIRLNSADSAFLSRTPASASNRKTWTWAGWVKRSGLGTSQYIFESRTGASDTTIMNLSFNASNQLQVVNYSYFPLISTSVYRDTSAWYHIVWSLDTTQATASNRMKLYVNGAEITTFGTDNRSSLTQNSDQAINQAAVHYIGGQNYLAGYLADIHLIDGQALDPTSFTEVDATTGQLIPKAYSGTYGTNGFRLDFSNPLDLGNDAAGTNDWTPNNLNGVSGGPTSVAAASGALPIYNTTDTYGATKGTGTRTDSNSSSIVLAIPMDGANNGTTFTDESATIKGSGSAKSITVNGNAKTVTSVSKFYGSSGAYDGTGDYLSLASSADFQLWNSTAWTVECFIYINSLASSFYFFGVGNRASTTTRCMLSVNTSGNVVIDWDGTSADTTVTFTTGLATGRWYHIAAASNGTTLKVYVDGIAASQTATLGTSTQANAPVSIAVPGLASNPATYNGLNGYLQDFRIYKGVAKYTANFNPPSATQNPTVAAGNDSLVDTPTSYGTDTGAGGEVRGNYVTLNPLSAGSQITLSNGNLDYSHLGNGISCRVYSTVAMSSGKWYCEHTVTTANQLHLVGIAVSTDSASQYLGQTAGSYGYYSVNGQKYNNGNQTAYGASYTNGDIIGIAFDADNGTLTFYKNGVSQGTAFSGIPAGSYYFGQGNYTGTTFTGSFNFGQRPFAYTAPSGFKALCDTNLPAPVVAKPSTVMDVKLWTGNGSSQTISGLGFSPDLVWIKARSQGIDWHALFNTVVGATTRLFSNSTSAEATNAQTLTAFNSDGFSVGNTSEVNGSSTTYVGWAWDAGSSTVTNTQGSITSQVRANPSAGFSICTFTTQSSGTGSFGHGLNVAPSLVITKARVVANNWITYHASVGNTGALLLNSTAATDTQSFYWNNTTPTSTVVTLGSGFAGSNSLVAYCFAPVAGYSSFGSYTGNGSADGPFVYTGFRPRFILLKPTIASRSWTIYDTARDTYNVGSAYLLPNLSDAEYSFASVDILSNGFKLRESAVGNNTSGAPVVYAAFAESPFQYARAR